MYPAIYRHKNTDYPIVIMNDGQQLSFELNGCYFYGKSLANIQTDGDNLPNYFALHYDELCDCEFIYQIPQQLLDMQGNHYDIKFTVHHQLGKPLKNGALDDETVIISFDFLTHHYTAKAGFYEDVLLALREQLKGQFYFKNCFGCLYSDYSIYGQSAFGDLLCFYEQKEKYLLIKDKQDYGYLCSSSDNFTCVQETFVCQNFKSRNGFVGYRY